MEDPAWYGIARGAYLGLCDKTVFEGVCADPVDLRGRHGGVACHLLIAHHDFVALWVQSYDVKRTRSCNPKAFALAYCIVPYPFVLAQNVALGVNDVAGCRLDVKEIGIVAAVEVLALRLLYGMEAKDAVYAFGLGLLHVAKREKDAGQLLLRKPVEKVALVLAGVHATLEAIATVVDILRVLYACIVARCKVVELDAGLTCVFHKCAELYLLVAPHAWVWSTSVQVFVPEVLKNLGLIEI